MEYYESVIAILEKALLYIRFNIKLYIFFDILTFILIPEQARNLSCSMWEEN